MPTDEPPSYSNWDGCPNCGSRRHLDCTPVIDEPPIESRKLTSDEWNAMGTEGYDSATGEFRNEPSDRHSPDGPLGWEGVDILDFLARIKITATTRDRNTNATPLTMTITDDEAMFIWDLLKMAGGAVKTWEGTVN